MGSTFEVSGWRKDENGQYGYLCVYRGESLFAALYEMFCCRKKYGNIKLDWRPNN